MALNHIGEVVRTISPKPLFWRSQEVGYSLRAPTPLYSAGGTSELLWFWPHLATCLLSGGGCAPWFWWGNMIFCFSFVCQIGMSRAVCLQPCHQGIAWLAVGSRDSLSLFFMVLKYSCTLLHLAFYVGARDLNSGPRDCTPSIFYDWVTVQAPILSFGQCLSKCVPFE